MVKTRAQREQGFVTPSPKAVKQVKRRKDTTSKRSGTTRNSVSGTGTTAKKESEIINTPLKTKKTKAKTRRSQNNKSPEDKQHIEENRFDENTVDGNHSDEEITEENTGQQETAVCGRRSSERGKKEHIDHKEKETEVQESDDAEDVDLMDEDDGQEEELEKEESEEEEEDEESENEDDETLHQKHQTDRVPIVEDQAAESDDDDDDDAPQDVSFSTSRQEALDSISQALEQTKRTEERAREKRRNRDKLLKLQKERKKISLEDTRLPEDFLSEVARISDGQPLETTAIAPPQQKTNQHHKVFDLDGEMEYEESEDYIPLSSSEPHEVEGFAVHAISRQERAPPPKSDTALDFLQKQLYGGKIKRESVVKHKAKMRKLLGKPSLAFHNSAGKKKKKHIRPGKTEA